MILLRNQKDSRLFKYDKRKSKKVSPLATLLIEHLTEESNGSITAAQKIKLKRILKVDVHASTVQRVRHRYLGNYLFKII